MKTIKKTVQFKASTHDVFEALMDSKKHAEFSGSTAKISRKVGGKFTAYNGYIEGTNLKIEKDKLIIQEWRGSDWPEGVYSTATFKITKTGAGSKLEFTQTGGPDAQYKAIKQGWTDYYWEPMKEVFRQ